jgi:hypothetical protein
LGHPHDWTDAIDVLFVRLRNLLPRVLGLHPSVRSRLFSSNCSSLSLYQQTGRKSGVDTGSQKSAPRSPAYRILYAVLTIIAGASVAFRFLILGKDIAKPFLVNLLLLLIAFVCCTYGFYVLLGLILEKFGQFWYFFAEFLGEVNELASNIVHMKEPECVEGPKALENFEEGMKAIFQVPKSEIVDPKEKGAKRPKSATSRKPKSSDED